MFNHKEYYRKYYQEHKEKMKINRNLWYKNNLEKVKNYNKKYREEHKEHFKNYMKKYRKEYRKNNFKKIRDYQYKWECNKRKSDLKYNLDKRMSALIRTSLKGNKKSRSWELLVGYTINELKNHLEKTLPKGYKWEECHIDHKIPISAFNYTESEHPDFKKCWALNNLQLLPIKENLIKSNKLDKPFQPALQLS